MFGSTTYGLAPDLLTCAKSLSSAYVPISAVMVSHRVHEALAANSSRIGTFGHGYTYSGHPVAAAVALETLQVYEDDGIVARVRALAPQFRERLQALGQRPLVGDVRAVGLIGALELMADGAARKPFDPALKVGTRVAALAQEEGLIVRAMGDVIALCPPLIIDAGQLDELFARLSRAFDRIARELASARSGPGSTT
jgi:4-aminobutyrate---pyruvate transaminase